MKNKNITINFLGEDRFSISTIRVYEVEKTQVYFTRWGDRCTRGTGEYETREEEGSYGTIYYPSLTTLYVDLLTFCNEELGTEFSIREDIRKQADSFRGQLESESNIGYEDGWAISKYSLELCHKYHYEDIRDCQSTWGCWDEESLIDLAQKLSDYFNEEDRFEMVRKSLYAYWEQHHMLEHINDEPKQSPSGFKYLEVDKRYL